MAISGIELVARSGPLVEMWNRRYGRSAGLCVVQRHCDGVPVTRHDSYKLGTQWQFDFCMAGPVAINENISALLTLMRAAIFSPKVKLQTA